MGPRAGTKDEIHIVDLALVRDIAGTARADSRARGRISEHHTSAGDDRKGERLV